MRGNEKEIVGEVSSLPQLQSYLSIPFESHSKFADVCAFGTVHVSRVTTFVRSRAIGTTQTLRDATVEYFCLLSKTIPTTVDTRLRNVSYLFYNRYIRHTAALP